MSCWCRCMCCAWLTLLLSSPSLSTGLGLVSSTPVVLCRSCSCIGLRLSGIVCLLLALSVVGASVTKLSVGCNARAVRALWCSRLVARWVRPVVCMAATVTWVPLSYPLQSQGVLLVP